MKAIHNFHRIVMASILAFATLGFIATPNTAQAQVKGATKLANVATVGDLQNLEAGDIVLMTCPKCKDTYATVVEKTTKGLGTDELKTVAAHLCPTCETKFNFDGTGKLADTKLVHTCKTCGSTDMTCCVMKKGSLHAHAMSDMK